MKQIIRKIMIIMLAVMMMSATAVMAEEGGSDGSSLGDLLGSLIPEDLDLGEALGGLKDQVSNVTGNLSEALGGLKDQVSNVTGNLGDALGGLLGNVTDEEGSLDKGKITDLLGSLFGGLGESGDGEAPEVLEEAFTEDATEAEADAAELYFTYFDEINEAIRNYVEESNADYVESGDESIFAMLIPSEQINDEGMLLILGYFIYSTYDADGTDLILKDAVMDTELLTLAMNEDGTFEVVDCQAAEYGDAYEESLEPLCEAVGITVDEMIADASIIDLSYVSEQAAFMEEHPEYERIEYAGELLTKEELDAVLDELIDEFLASFDLAETEETEAAN